MTDEQIRAALIQYFNNPAGLRRAATLPPGARIGAQTRSVAHLSDGRWEAALSWPTPDAYDDDPDSQTCWCQYSMQSHAHGVIVADSLDALVVALKTGEIRRA